MTINDLYAAQSIELADARSALQAERQSNMNACMVLLRLSTGELQTSQVSVIQGADGSISWKIEAPPLEATA